MNTENNNISMEEIEAKVNELLQNKWRHFDTVDIEQVVVKNFIDYGASVIIGRAIPDLRDGLKPSQRRVLYAMKNLGLGYTGGFKKSARIVGDTIGKYHPHGDSSAYETMINLSQPWKQNLPLIDGQGNWGSIDGDSAAAQRYTEARFTKYGYMMFNDIDKNIVDFIPNYDGTEIEPKVLPAPFPNILINGVLQGSIAVGMASTILPHNPEEIMEALIALLDARKNKKEFTAEDMMEYVKAPDFPTGGIVYNLKDMKKIIEEGKGSIRVRAKYHIEKKGRSSIIVVDEIPYGKLKSKIIEEIVNLRKEVNNKKDSKISDFDKKILQNITNIRDESDKGIRIVIELKSSTEDPELVWNYLIKNTSLDISLSYNAVVIDEIENSRGEKRPAPKRYGLLNLLKRYLDFREELQRRKWTYIKEKTETRLHIIEGLLKAIDIIDKIIEEIKLSKNSKEALEKLVEKFNFSEIQAKAIIDMRLARLTGIEKSVLEKENKDLNEILEKANKILNDKNYFYRILKNDLKKTVKEISKPRKTEIRYDIGNIDMKELIPNEECIIYVTNKGYLKRVPLKEINKQNKGTQGSSKIYLTEGDFIQKIFKTKAHSILLFIMKSGKVYGLEAYNIPTTNRGTYIENLIETENGDKIVSVAEINNFEEEKNLVMVTEKGLIKKTSLKEYSGAMRKGGVIGIKTKEDDKVISADVIDKKDIDIIILTENAKCIRFEIKDVSQTGRMSMGVKGITLAKKDKVVSSTFVREGDYILSLTDSGIGKISKENVYKKQTRGGKGATCIKTDGSKAISIISFPAEKIDEYELVCVTKTGKLNKIPLNNIKSTGRNTKGVKLINLKENDKLTEAVGVIHID